MELPSGLEDKTRGTVSDTYRSDGERRIAATLEQYAIPFVYEQPVRIQANGRTKTLRPDFYLPEFNLYIEYFGRVGNQDYDLRTAEKQAAYAAKNLNLLPVYPWDLIQDWPNYLLDRLRKPPYQKAWTENPTKHYLAATPSYRRTSTRTTPAYGHGT